jgi:hypothetical protein
MEQLDTGNENYTLSKNNDWYLIGLTKTSYDGATAATDEDDYNLLTGDFIQTKTDSGSATLVITKI